ncbi:MAG: DUF4136 domain-containing protein [Longimicrobiales bacterium]
MRLTLPRCIGLAGLASALACDSDLVTAGDPVSIVAAFRDMGTVFGDITTYALPDSVVHLTKDPTAEAPIEITRGLDDRILAHVRTQLDDRGYVREPQPEQSRPDVIVLVNVVATTDFASWTNYPWFAWWGFFPGFAFAEFDPTWGIEYPWSDEAIGFEYDAGTIVIEMIDARGIDEPDQSVRAVWSGAVNGALTSDAGAEEARVLGSIEEVFALSPYLRHEP